MLVCLATYVACNLCRWTGPDAINNRMLSRKWISTHSLQKTCSNKRQLNQAPPLLEIQRSCPNIRKPRASNRTCPGKHGLEKEMHNFHLWKKKCKASHEAAFYGRTNTNFQLAPNFTLHEAAFYGRTNTNFQKLAWPLIDNMHRLSNLSLSSTLRLSPRTRSHCFPMRSKRLQQSSRILFPCERLHLHEHTNACHCSHKGITGAGESLSLSFLKLQIQALTQSSRKKQKVHDV